MFNEKLTAFATINVGKNKDMHRMLRSSEGKEAQSEGPGKERWKGG